MASIGLRGIVASLALVGLSAAPLPAMAQAWPTKPVHILIGFGAGGGTDVATRIVAEGLSEVLGQKFTVENRPGAGGTIAGGQVARAAPDGYTALAISMGHSVSAVMVKTVPYDPVQRLCAGRHLHQLRVRSRSAEGFAGGRPQEPGRARQQAGGKLNYSTVGLGSTQHLIAEALRQQTNMQAQPVSYRTTGDVVSALLRGDAAFAVELYHAIRGQIDAGALRVLAVATPERWPGLKMCRPWPRRSPASDSAAGTGSCSRRVPRRRSSRRRTAR